MDPQSPVLLSDVVNDHCLRVEFLHRGDRYAHVISLVEPGGLLDSSGQATPLLESVEGSPADHWPASPPLQNLHLQELPDGRRVALLVGMAGRSHWSASIETVPGQAALLFDIACRTSEPAAALGNRYRLQADADTRLHIEALADATVLRDGNVLSIAPTHATSPLQKTRRWKYRVVLNHEP